MKRKKGGKRCVEAGRAAGKADAMARIERWQREASGEVAERLQALGDQLQTREMMLRGLAVATVAGENEPRTLRQDW